MDNKANQQDKIIIRIFVSPDSQCTKNLYEKIDPILTELNKNNIILRFVKVTQANKDQIIKQFDIHRCPTLAYRNTRKIGIDDIVAYLITCIKVRRSQKASTTPEDLMTKYQRGILDLGDNKEDDEDEKRSDTIRKKMEEFQKRRPKMMGVDSASKLPGGKPVKAVKRTIKFSDDGDGDKKFVEQSGINEINPPAQYSREEDGDMTLENYYLDEAIRSGKQVKTKPRKGR